MSLLLRLLAPPPDIEPLPSDAVRPAYKYWRLRQLYTTFLGYLVFYFVRVNIPVAFPLMQQELGFSKAQLGAIQSIHAVVYGVSKFLNGMLADRSNPRYFMALGLLVSGLLNVCFGLSSGFYVLGFFWLLNGWVQGMGFPPCARVLSNWYSPKERGRYWSIWNTSHQVGAALGLLLAGFLAAHYGWRYVFVGPALIAVAVSLFIVERLRDTPGSLGLPPVEQYTGEQDMGGTKRHTLSPEAFKKFVQHVVFRNPVVWLVCVGNFFVYTVRYGFLNWAPSYLQDVKHIPVQQASAMVSGFEMAGLVGSVLAGWLTDKFFRSRRAPVCVAFMVGTAASIAFFWKMPAGSPGYESLSLLAVGFLIYGPQLLVGITMADVCTRQAAATAIGLTGVFGYGSEVLSGWGLGHIVDHYGWDFGFELLIVCALLGAVPFMLCWRVVPVAEEDLLRRLDLASA